MTGWLNELTEAVLKAEPLGVVERIDVNREVWLRMQAEKTQRLRPVRDDYDRIVFALVDRNLEVRLAEDPAAPPFRLVFR